MKMRNVLILSFLIFEFSRGEDQKVPTTKINKIEDERYYWSEIVILQLKELFRVEQSETRSIRSLGLCEAKRDFERSSNLSVRIDRHKPGKSCRVRDNCLWLLSHTEAYGVKKFSLGV